MMIVRLTVILAMVLSLGIASTSASYQQPKRPSRAEAERAREIEKQKRDALAQARVDANTAAQQIFERYHTESCDQPGTWTRKGELLNNYNQAMGATYKPRYWFTQFRGLHPIAPHPDFGFKKPDAATAANYPDVDYVAEFYITAEVKRNFRCTIKTKKGEIHEDFGGCRWTLWESPAPVMSLTIWRRGGEWKLKEDVEFHSDTNVYEWDRPSWFKPTCDEVRRGKSEEAEAVERAEALKKKALESEHNAEIKEYLEEANQAFELQYRGLIEKLFTSCRAVQNSCYYKVGNYTWTVGEGRVKDGRTPWGPWGDGYGPEKANPAQMYYEKPVTITISGLKGSCNSRMPNDKFEVRLQYHFGQRNRAWRLAIGSTPLNAYYDAPDDINKVDMVALRARDNAPPLCR